MKNFIEASWLKDNLDEVVVIDVRYDLHSSEYGMETYAKGHIPGAYYLDVDRDLAGEKGTHGGSRPVPAVEGFIEKIEAMGITRESKVVIYDENMITGSRAFWMLRYVGHENVRLLNGGFKAWLEAGGDVTADIPETVEGTKYEYEVQEEIFCDIDYVKSIDDSSVLVECRSHDRYLGMNEPFYHKAGHIPKAVCIDSKSLLTDGKVKSPIELAEIFKGLKDAEEVLFYCGSGINAALDYVAYDEVGGSSKIYIGGFSDWISYEENPVETKDEN